MDRLTKQNYKFDMLNVMRGLGKCTEIDEILNRLSAYEDTGRNPDEVAALDHDVAMFKQSARTANEFAIKNVELRKENATLKKALELMYLDNKGYNHDGMGNPAYYMQKARESVD